MKPQAQLQEVLADSAELFFGADGAAAQRELRRGEHALPSVDLLRMARVRLDMMSMLFEQFLSRHFKYLRYFQVDASNQLGLEFLLIKEDRIAIPRASSGPFLRVEFDLNAAFYSRVCPCSVLGKYNAGVVKKSCNMANCLMTESGSEAMFHEKRKEARGLTTDHGTEKAMADDTVAVLGHLATAFPVGSDDSFMYPQLLPMFGHMHILFNALEETVCKVKQSEDFLDKMKTVEAFLSDREMRNLFTACCLGEASHGEKDTHPPVRPHKLKVRVCCVSKC